MTPTQQREFWKWLTGECLHEWKPTKWWQNLSLQYYFCTVCKEVVQSHKEPPSINLSDPGAKELMMMVRGALEKGLDVFLQQDGALFSCNMGQGYSYGKTPPLALLSALREYMKGEKK